MTETEHVRREWPDGWPVCFSANMSDDDARKHAALQLNCKPEDIELLRHNVVLCRYNPNQEEDGDGLKAV